MTASSVGSLIFSSTNLSSWKLIFFGESGRIEVEIKGGAHHG